MDPEFEIRIEEAAKAQLESYRQAHETQLLVILLTDLVGSTSQQSRLGNLRAAELVQEHRRIFRGLLATMDGQEIETAGDAFLTVFAAPSEAVLFALRMQLAMRDARTAEPDLPTVRVGIHMGQVVVERHAEGSRPVDLYGLQVSTASRIMDLADGDQILCSRQVFNDARSILRGEQLSGLAPVVWQNHGPYVFKGVESESGVAESYEVCEAGESGYAPLARPAGKPKSYPAEAGDEIFGWRPGPDAVLPRGGWRMAEKLGEGGFGEVWRAQDPGGRETVFKFCTKRSKVRSLRREYEVFNALVRDGKSPPGIVEVIEAHDDAEGDPPYYIRLKYVAGGDLKHWIDRRGKDAPLRIRLELALQMARAVARIHEAGFVHRDLKPSNFLVEPEDDPDRAPALQLCDFGIGHEVMREALAGATASQALPGGGGQYSVHSESLAQAAGTYVFIAPELLLGGADTPGGISRQALPAADIYSLGVTLFQLFSGDTGRAPGVGLTEVDDAILREDIAACLAGDPAQRPGIAELVERLDRHDIRAREREADIERRRQQARNRRITAVAAVAGLVALVSVAFGGYALMQRREAEAQRDRAAYARSTAEDLVNFMLFDLRDRLQPIGRLDLLETVAERAFAYYESLPVDEYDDDAERQRAAALTNVGIVLIALGNSSGAIEAYKAGLEISQRLAELDPSNSLWQRDLSNSWNLIGYVRLAQGDSPGALEAYEAALEIRERLAAVDPANTQWQSNLSASWTYIGDVRLAQGDSPGALEVYEASQEIRERLAAVDPANTQWQRDLAVSWIKIGNVRLAQGDSPGALKAYEASLEISQRLAELDPDNMNWQRDLSVSWNMIGDVRLAQGDSPGALEAYEAALEIRERLAELDPDNTEWQRDLSVSWNKIGDVRVGQGDSSKALEAYEASLVISQRLAVLDPFNMQWQRDLSISWDKIGNVRLAQDDLSGALEAYQAVLEVVQRLAALEPANTEWQRDLSVSWNDIGNVRRAQVDLPGALEAYEAALEISQLLAAVDPSNTQWQRDLSVSWDKIGGVRLAQGDSSGALEAYEAGLEISQRLAELDPSNTLWQRDLSVSWNKIGNVRLAQGDSFGSLEAYEAALEIRERLAAVDPSNTQWQRDLSVSWEKIGDVRLAQGDLPGAIEAYEHSVTGLGLLADQFPDDAQRHAEYLALARSYARLLHLDLDEALDMLARKQYRSGLVAEAVATQRQALALLAEADPNRPDFAGRLHEYEQALGEGQPE